ncbi:response regulator transcription factor [Compostibacter hankyongensis]|uniref:Response regulator transcription factor n=2 Tax=Compostibacter hankyongensis TaxID=1007089 RepID=A0ABP8FG51_9BACT
MPPPKIRIAIVDDHPIVIEGLKMLLVREQDIAIAGCFVDGAGIRSFLGTNEADVVLLDITLPDINGMELCREIKKLSPSTLVLVISNHSERSIIMQSIQNGASGYLLKNASLEELTGCIHEALSGNITFSKEVKDIISRPTKNELKGVPQLTKRERQILKLLAEGRTSAMIAEALFISPLTVDTHRRNLMQKFEVKNAAELIMAATQQQLL